MRWGTGPGAQIRLQGVAVEDRLDAERGLVGGKLVVGRAIERAGGRLDLVGEQAGVARRDHEQAGSASTKRTARPIAAGSFNGSYQANRGSAASSVQRRRATDLIVCSATPSALATSNERLDVGSIDGLGQQRVVVREQHAVEREALQRAQVHLGDAQTMAGDADVAHEPLVASAGERLDGAARAVGDVPLVGLDEVVQLDRVDVVNAHPLQRPLELGAGCVTTPFAGLGGEEHLVAVLAQPALQPILGCAVRRGRVDVVDAPAGDGVERGVGALLAHAAERGGAEDQASGGMSGPPEWCGRDHVPNVLPVVRPVQPRQPWVGCRRRPATPSPGGGRRRSARSPAHAARARWSCTPR